MKCTCTQTSTLFIQVPTWRCCGFIEQLNYLFCEWAKCWSRCCGYPSSYNPEISPRPLPTPATGRKSGTCTCVAFFNRGNISSMNSMSCATQNLCSSNSTVGRVYTLFERCHLGWWATVVQDNPFSMLFNFRGLFLISGGK